MTFLKFFFFFVSHFCLPGSELTDLTASPDPIKSLQEGRCEKCTGYKLEKGVPCAVLG
jgi:hypothetical protein